MAKVYSTFRTLHAKTNYSLPQPRISRVTLWVQHTQAPENALCSGNVMKVRCSSGHVKPLSSHGICAGYTLPRADGKRDETRQRKEVMSPITVVSTDVSRIQYNPTFFLRMATSVPLEYNCEPSYRKTQTVLQGDSFTKCAGGNSKVNLTGQE